MRFTSLRLSNFRSTRELEIGFKPDVTVIVGRNGAGKSSILDALAMIIGLARSQSAETRKSTADLLDSEAVQGRSLRKDLQAIGDLDAWWNRREAQEAHRVRDGERGYRDLQLEAIRDLIARIDNFSGVFFNATISPSRLH